MVGYAPAGGVGMLDPPASQQAEPAFLVVGDHFKFSTFCIAEQRFRLRMCFVFWLRYVCTVCVTCVYVCVCSNAPCWSCVDDDGVVMDG